MSDLSHLDLLTQFKSRLEELYGEYRSLPTGVGLVDFLAGLLASEDLCPAIFPARLRGLANELSNRGIKTIVIEPSTESRTLVYKADPRLSVGITPVDALISETGTLAIASTGAGERIASLVPPIHIALLLDTAIYKTLEEFLAESDPSKTWQFISGPSRTADIEKVLVLGVHGPTRLVVIGPGS